MKLKENKSTILGILIIGLIAYGIKLITYSFSIDTEELIADRTRLLTGWLMMDRYGLVFIKNIIDFASINIFLANLIGFIFLYLSSIICIYNMSMLTNNKDKRINVILRGYNFNKSNNS